jgi:hypothetical protein
MRLLACHSLTCASLALAIWHLPLNSGGLRGGKDLLVVWVAPSQPASQPGKPASCRDSLPPKERYVKDYIKKLIIKT